jgi:oxalate decarboxylase
MAHTPRAVLAKNFGVPQRSLEGLPEEELFIFQAEVPGPLEEDQRAAAGSLGISRCDFAFRVSQSAVNKRTQWGDVRIVDSSRFKVSNTVASALVTIKPGGMRELHWHPNADEWQYHIAGQARMTVFTSGGRARTMDFQAGDVGYVPKVLPHYVENVGKTDLKFLEMFKTDRFQELSLSEWLTHTPPELVMAHLNIDRGTLKAIPSEQLVLVG